MIYTHPEKKLPTIPDLVSQIKAFYGLPEEEVITVAKYFIPSAFDWKVFDPTEEIVTKKKKNTIKSKASEFDLRQFPYMLKDGDIIGVRIEKENTTNDNEFQTE